MKRLLRKTKLLIIAVMIGVANAMNPDDETVSSNWYQTEQEIDLDDPE